VEAKSATGHGSYERMKKKEGRVDGIRIHDN
jgi:hypothetical protein